ncbi:MAG: 30S ribosomal protein S11 [Patescibacteria group bacterium]
MGKKRIIKKATETADEQTLFQVARTKANQTKKKFDKGIVNVHSSYNNTLITLTDEMGNTIFQSSSGALGFRGSKKGTPYAASRAAEIVGEFAQALGLKEVLVKVNGIGAGRDSAVRVFVQRGFSIPAIKDLTPIPHGHPRLKKPRRV